MLISDIPLTVELSKKPRDICIYCRLGNKLREFKEPLILRTWNFISVVNRNKLSQYFIITLTSSFLPVCSVNNRAFWRSLYRLVCYKQSMTREWRIQMHKKTHYSSNMSSERPVLLCKRMEMLIKNFVYLFTSFLCLPKMWSLLQKQNLKSFTQNYRQNVRPRKYHSI